MLKIDRQNKLFSRLESPTLADVSISERYGLQEYICNSPTAFFQEIGQQLFLIDKELTPSDDVDDRIDLLALDKEGQAVIVELKRGNHKLQMLQAISYAGMVAKWQPEDFLGCLSTDKQEKLLDFLEVEKEDINRKQRIILVAEAFDYSILIGAEWLTEQHGVDILCCRISVAKDTTGNAEFLVCSNIFPAPELAQQAIRRGRGRTVVSTPKWTDWDAALKNIDNLALVSFYKKELEAGQENYLLKRLLRYRIDGKRRWFMAARRRNAYVWQNARFDGDIEFWRKGMSQPEQVKPVNSGLSVSFPLITESDFSFFRVAVTETLTTVKWEETGSDDDVEVDGKEDV